MDLIGQLWMSIGHGGKSFDSYLLGQGQYFLFNFSVEIGLLKSLGSEDFFDFDVFVIFFIITIYFAIAIQQSQSEKRCFCIWQNLIIFIYLPYFRNFTSLKIFERAYKTGYGREWRQRSPTSLLTWNCSVFRPCHNTKGNNGPKTSGSTLCSTSHPLQDIL